MCANVIRKQCRDRPQEMEWGNDGAFQRKNTREYAKEQQHPARERQLWAGSGDWWLCWRRNHTVIYTWWMVTFHSSLELGLFTHRAKSNRSRLCSGSRLPSGAPIDSTENGNFSNFFFRCRLRIAIQQKHSNEMRWSRGYSVFRFSGLRPEHKRLRFDFGRWVKRLSSCWLVHHRHNRSAKSNSAMSWLVEARGGSWLAACRTGTFAPRNVNV